MHLLFSNLRFVLLLLQIYPSTKSDRKTSFQTHVLKIFRGQTKKVWDELANPSPGFFFVYCNAVLEHKRRTDCSAPSFDKRLIAVTDNLSRRCPCCAVCLRGYFALIKCDLVRCLRQEACRNTSRCRDACNRHRVCALGIASARTRNGPFLASPTRKVCRLTSARHKNLCNWM